MKNVILIQNQVDEYNQKNEQKFFEDQLFDVEQFSYRDNLNSNSGIYLNK